MVKNFCQKSWKGINTQVWEYGHLGDFFLTLKIKHQIETYNCLHLVKNLKCRSQKTQVLRPALLQLRTGSESVSVQPSLSVKPSLALT